MPPQVDLQVMRRDIDNMSRDITEIKKALLGNEEFGVEGYIAKINDIDERLTRMEERYKAGRWIGLGILITAGYGVKGFVDFIIDILKP